MGIVAVPVLFQSVFCFSVSGPFWSHLYARCLSWSLLWFLLELYSRQVDVTKAKAEASSVTPDCLLDCSPFYESWACPASFCACFLWCRLGLAQWLGLAEIFLPRCSTPVGIWEWRGQDPGSRSKAKCHSVHLGSHRVISPFLFVRVSAVREVLLGEILPWGCPISHAIENPIEALDEEDRLRAANTQLFYCITNSLVCLTLDVPWYISQCAGQLLWSCSHTGLTLSCQSLLNQRLVLVLRTALARPRASHAPMQNVVLSGFGLQIMQPFQTHLSPLMYSWQK